MSHHESTAKGPDGRMVDRMLFFSDAVFAIVLTIMVLELHAPLMEAKDMTAAQSAAVLWAALGGMFRIFFAYIISFILVSLWWSIHMRVTRHLHVFDWPTAILNLVFILSVSLTPFAASVLGENLMNGAAWTIYWGVSALASFTLTLLMFVVSRDDGRLIGGMSARERIARLLQSIGPGIGFAVGAWLAYIGELNLSRWCWLVIWPVAVTARMIYSKSQPKVEAPAADA